MDSTPVVPFPRQTFHAGRFASPPPADAVVLLPAALADRVVDALLASMRAASTGREITETDAIAACLLEGLASLTGRDARTPNGPRASAAITSFVLLYPRT